MIRRLLLALALLWPAAALAQSNPGLVQGQVPTAGQWNSYFAAKADYPVQFGGAGVTVAVRSTGAATVTAVAVSDYFLCLDPTSNAITTNLPSSPALGLTFLIKDCTGKAATNNITVKPASGTIDGIAAATGFVMNINYQSIAVTYTGAQWSIN